jgi:hypothetical protein
MRNRNVRRRGITAAALLMLMLGAGAARAEWDTAGTLSPGTTVLDAFASEVSVAPGGTVHFHVSTSPREPYRIVIYRLGWWRGPAPPRLACVPSCRGATRGVAQAMPSPDPVTGAVAASWPTGATFHVPRAWRSGYYLAKVILMRGPRRGRGKLVPFIVREGRHRAKLLVIAAVNTWEAYNRWGGTSLYLGGPSTVHNRYPDAPHAVKASFSRPYYDFRFGGPSLFDWELPLARFLERVPYDVSYTTDVDVDRNPASLLGRRVVIVAGHSEYWTITERRALERARDSGVNVVFAGGNDGYWQIRYEDGRRTIVGYKGQTDWSGNRDPLAGTESETTKFRDLATPDPECLLVGVQHGGLAGAPGYSAFATNPSRSAWFASTGFTAGASLGPIVGYEWDQIYPRCTPPGTGFTTLFHTPAGGTNGVPYDSVVYTAPSGARVFAAGTFEFSWGLDSYGEHEQRGRQAPDERLQQFTLNMLDDLSGTGPLAKLTVPGEVSVRQARRRGIPLAVSLSTMNASVVVDVLRGRSVLASTHELVGSFGTTPLRVRVRGLRRGRAVTVRVVVRPPSGGATAVATRRLTLSA